MISMIASVSPEVVNFTIRNNTGKTLATLSYFPVSETLWNQFEPASMAIECSLAEALEHVDNTCQQMARFE